MFIKNNTNKIINIGTAQILMPGDTAEISAEIAELPSIKALVALKYVELGAFFTAPMRHEAMPDNVAVNATVADEGSKEESVTEEAPVVKKTRRKKTVSEAE